MRRLIVCLMGVVAVLVVATGVSAQELLVPAGTLLQCTMDEPNFSSATASVGDPVLCHLRSFQEFGRTVFPRGSMLAGHLEADKEPGHFVGKGYLKITFDRVIVPSGDVPLPAKVISAKGYKVDKEGDIKGKGHAKRDVAEWLFPPLWPWKVAMLPARGPRPAMKGEEPMQLRLMDDIVVPRNVAAFAIHGDRPPYASSNEPKPAASSLAPPQAAMIHQAAVAEKPALPMPASNTNLIPVAMPASQTTVAPATPAEPAARVTILVLKSNQVLEVTKYRIDGGQVHYQAVNGAIGAIDNGLIDWRQTTQMTNEVRSVDLPAVARQTN